MTHYDRLKRKKLGDILVDEGLVSRESVITALQEQQHSGRLLSDILIDAREISEYDLAKIIVEQYQTPFLDLKSYSLHKDLIESFPKVLLHEARVVPLERFGAQVCFACQEIPGEGHVARLREHSGGGMFFYVVSSYDVRTALAEYAPVTGEDLVVEAAEAGGVGEGGGEWQGLFDAANEAILHDLEELPVDPDDG